MRWSLWLRSESCIFHKFNLQMSCRGWSSKNQRQQLLHRRNPIRGLSTKCDFIYSLLPCSLHTSLIFLFLFAFGSFYLVFHLQHNSSNLNLINRFFSIWINCDYVWWCLVCVTMYSGCWLCVFHHAPCTPIGSCTVPSFIFVLFFWRSPSRAALMTLTTYRVKINDTPKSAHFIQLNENNDGGRYCCCCRGLLLLLLLWLVVLLWQICCFMFILLIAYTPAIHSQSLCRIAVTKPHRTLCWKSATVAGS